VQQQRHKRGNAAQQQKQAHENERAASHEVAMGMPGIR